MSRVKILKTEIEENDLPLLCMICGKNAAESRHDWVARLVPFPMGLLGILGDIVTPYKTPMNVTVCSGCKSGFQNEQNMGILWKLLKTFIPISFLAVFGIYSATLPKSLLGPIIFAVSVYMLETLYFWGIGKKYAIRCDAMDHGTVSIRLPSGMWGVGLTTYRREKEFAEQNYTKLPTKPPPGTVAPTPVESAPAPVAPPAAAPPPKPPSIATPPAAAPVAASSDPFADSPPPPVSSNPFAEPASTSDPFAQPSGALKGSEFGRLPENLPPLFDAVKMGDMDRLKKALADGETFDDTLESGLTCLHVAAIAGDMQMADGLLRKGISPNIEMANGLTPMHLAVQSNNQTIVGLLMAKKANPNHQNHEGRTPLHWCAAIMDERLSDNDRYKMANVLMRGGGDITVTDCDGKTPAQLATESGFPDVAEAFS